MEFMVPFLRIIHILSGIIWVGGTIYGAAFLVPTARRLGPEAAPFMRSFMSQSGMPVVMALVGWFTVLAGLALFPFTSGRFDPAWMRSSTGIAFSLGALFGIAGAIIGGVWLGRASAQLAAVVKEVGAKGGPPSPEQSARMQALQQRLAVGGVINSVVLVIAAAIMAVARYV